MLWHLGYHDEHGYESETIVGRYLGEMQWLYPYVGFDYHYKKEGGIKNIFGGEQKNWFGQLSNKNNPHTAVAGIAYTLPTLTVADIRIDGDVENSAFIYPTPMFQLPHVFVLTG